jgi:TPR repeat protein
MKNLSDYYQNGQGTIKDLVKSFEWCMKSAESSNKYVYNMMEKKESFLYLHSLEDRITFENEKYSPKLKEIVKNLLSFDPSKRMELDEILNELKF